jgi:hypothetical protein
MDRIDESERKKNSLSRREFLKIAAVGTGAFLVGNSLLGEYIDGLDPEIPQITDIISEYKIAWQARPWVWINLAIASGFINDRVIHPNEEISLIDLMGFDGMKDVPRDNTDPRKGYIAAQMSNPLKLDGWGYGLCLASTAIFRACLESPLRIMERGTHYDIYGDYFKDFPTGTDAAVFYPEPGDKLPKTDLKLMNPTDVDLKLGLNIFDAFGNLLQTPEKDTNEIWFKATYLDQLTRVLRKKINIVSGVELPRQYLPEEAFGNRKIVVQASISGHKPDYNTKMGPVKHGDSTVVNGVTQYVFERLLSIHDSIRGEMSFTEKFISQYR